MKGFNRKNGISIQSKKKMHYSGLISIKISRFINRNVDALRARISGLIFLQNVYCYLNFF